MCESVYLHFVLLFFFFKQKTAYEMRISDWSSDVCSSDLLQAPRDGSRGKGAVEARPQEPDGGGDARLVAGEAAEGDQGLSVGRRVRLGVDEDARHLEGQRIAEATADQVQHEVEGRRGAAAGEAAAVDDEAVRAHCDLRKARGEVLEVLPMGRRRAAVEKAGAGEQDRKSTRLNSSH